MDIHIVNIGISMMMDGNQMLILMFLGAKKRLYKRLRRSVGWLVRPSVGPYVGPSPRSNYVEN
jgi:hypothetical protein